MTVGRLAGLLGTLAVLAPALVCAQPLTIDAAVRLALAQDPAVAAAAAEREAATVSIDVARQAYRPRLDGLVQINRATHNNVSGLLFPQPIISPISGPPSLENSSSSVWGTAVGALVTWQPIDFGARRAAEDVARAGEARGLAAERLVQLDRAARAADAYLSVLAADATLRAAQAAEARAAVVRSVAEALVGGELRPGVDAETARAEHAAATLQVVQARRATRTARAALAAVLGAPATGPLVALPPPPADDGADGVPPTHPALAEWHAAAQEAAARQQAAKRSADPVLALQGTLYGRGTGVLDDNSSGTGANGLGLEAYNWAVGLTVTVPAMEWANRHQREAVEALRAKAAEARQQDAAREMQRRVDVARQDREAAREVAAQTAVIVESARQVAAQARARYQAGLNTITDVADAERRLAQAEIDRGLADLAIWRAQLALAHATADGVDAFLRALP